MELFAENHADEGEGRDPRFFPGDPRISMLATVLLIAAAFALRHFRGVSFLLFYVLVLHLLCGFSLPAIWKRTRRITLFALLAMMLNAVLVRGEVLISLGGFSVMSKEGLWRGAYYFVQIHVLFLASGLLVARTSPEQFAKAVSSALSPIAPAFARRMALYAFLALGFLPFFIDEFNRIATLQKFRGGGLTGGLVQKLRGVRLLLVPLLLSAVHRSAQLAMVIELRDLKDKAGGLIALERPRWRDYAFIILTLLVIASAYLFSS